MDQYKLHTGDYDIVHVSHAGAGLITHERPEDDLWVIEGVKLDQLKLVARFCDDYATDAEKTALLWADNILMEQSLEWRYELKEAAKTMGVQGLENLFSKVAAKEESETFTICSKDGGTFGVTRAILKMNNTLDNMVGATKWLMTPEGGATKCGNGQTMVPVPTVDTSTLTHVVGFCKEFIVNPPDTKAKYIELVKAMVNTDAASLITAADFLSNAALLDVCARGIAARIESLTVEEMRQYILGNSDAVQMEVVEC